MKVEKEKRKVNIIFQDGSSVKGFIHINPGERVLDFISGSRKSFIAMTSVEFYYPKRASFPGFTSKSKKNDTIILNKSAIKWVEEI